MKCSYSGGCRANANESGLCWNHDPTKEPARAQRNATIKLRHVQRARAGDVATKGEETKVNKETTTIWCETCGFFHAYGNGQCPHPPPTRVTPDMVIADLRDIGGRLARWISNSDHAPDCNAAGDPSKTCSCGRDSVLNSAREKGLLAP